MASQPRCPPMHETMLGMKIPHPISTNWDDEFPTPAAKRPKYLKEANTRPDSEESDYLHSVGAAQKQHAEEIPDSEEEDEEEEQSGQQQTQLETSLPHLQNDAEAIEAYEAYKAGLSEPATAQERIERRSWVRGRTSIYVDAFRLALDTVLEDEGHLFNDAERVLFKQWMELPYESQYLYVRLFLRKTSAWHRIGKLGYYSDIADLEGAVLDLQNERKLPQIETKDSHAEDLAPPPESSVLTETFTFAECSSVHITTLDEASSLLLLDELKTIAKDAKVNGKNKKELLHNLRRTSKRQGGLGLERSDTQESTGSTFSEGTDTGEGHDSGANTPSYKVNRDAHFTAKILSQTGRCIRLSLAPLRLFERVHLVFYRSTEWTEKSLTTLILAKISRRNFPAYIVSRSNSIFESREFLLEFEASLRLQFKVDNILEFNGPPGKKGYEEVRSIFESVYPRWQALLTKEQSKEDTIYESGEGAYLRRFSPAWVYTRIVHKGLSALGRDKEHKREHDILSELLSQRLFHAARRGAWYSRKALLEEHYMHALVYQSSGPKQVSDEAWKRHWKRVALGTCEEGLRDKDCHVIYHYDLQKRIKKLEKQLRISWREQHQFSHVSLGQALERTIEGVKIEKITDTEQQVANKEKRRPSLAADGSRRGAKTVWFDELDTHGDVSVESMCLSHYRKVLGWKGYHSEGGILRTLFGLLFHDVLFEVYVPNVFQTAYQTCPLDLHTDAFYSTRVSEINARINDLANGEAERILRRTWEAHFDSKTCVVGVRWEEYELEDLIEISRCFEGQKLGVVMRVMAQEYASRGGGVPDLFLWKVQTVQDEGNECDNVQVQHPETAIKGQVMFVEVKSENDRLSDTQRLWISVLLGAGIPVELCHALAREVRLE